MNSNQDRLNEAGRQQWNRKAAFWDSLHGAEGNNFHRHLISPAVERLLALTHLPQANANQRSSIELSLK